MTATERPTAVAVTPENPYLRGNFAPVHEEVAVERLEIAGSLPDGLEGMFVRNGPNPQFAPKGRYHWFDGDGMLHGVLLRDGAASYRNRWVRTRGFELEREQGAALWSGLTEIPPFADPPHGMLFKNAANTALVWHHGRLLALWEGGDPHQIELPSLDTVGRHDFGGALRSPFTAHPKVDPSTGEMMFFGYNPMGPDFLVYGVVGAGGEIVHCAPIRIPRGVMMHDFAITERYTLFLDLPLVFDPRRVLQGESPFHFDRDLPSRYGIVPRHGGDGDVRWFEGPPCYVFHTLNAYEEGDQVVLLGCRMETTDVLAPPGHSTRDPGHTGAVEQSERGGSVGSLHEWRFDLATGALRERRLADRPTDFPRCDDRRAGRPIRTGFAARFAPGERMPLFDGLVRYDLDSGREQSHLHGRGRHGGEGVFVPRPGAEADDDGWLLTLVHDQAAGISELVVVEAGDMDSPPVARVILPRRVPWGFHAAWVPASAIAG